MIVEPRKAQVHRENCELQTTVRVNVVVWRLVTQVEFLCFSLEAEFLLWETSVFALKAISWLDEAHLYYNR
jgi:hypothetical protein